MRPRHKLCATTFTAVVLAGCAGTPPPIYGRQLMNGYLVPTQINKYPVVKKVPVGVGVVLVTADKEAFDCWVTRKGTLDLTWFQLVNSSADYPYVPQNGCTRDNDYPQGPPKHHNMYK
jgi:hypothetical protein